MQLLARLLPLLCASLLAGCAADTTDEDVDSTDDGTTDVTEALGAFKGFFISPSGKNYCWLGNIAGENIARCEWKGGGDWAVELDGAKPGHKIHVTDTVYSNRYTLHYGAHVSSGPIRCTVNANTGVTCKNTKTGHGFTSSVQSQRVF